jgi:hypothetical protein
MLFVGNCGKAVLKLSTHNSVYASKGLSRAQERVLVIHRQPWKDKPWTDKPWTRQTLDMTNPEPGKPWTRQTLWLGFHSSWTRSHYETGSVIFVKMP